MSTKNELQLVLKTFGYELNPNTSKDTLVSLLHSHSKALKHGIDVAKMNDHELRVYLNQYHILVGPVIGHTRAIYQHQLLQAIGGEDVKDKVNGDNQRFDRLSVDVENGIVMRSGRIVYRDRP